VGEKETVVSNGFSVDKKTGQLIREPLKEPPKTADVEKKCDKSEEASSGKVSAAAEKTSFVAGNENSSFADHPDVS
jgi:hypothetical protein